MNTMEITANKKVDKTTLEIIKESFEEQKNITILSIFEKNNDIYGVYVNPIQSSLSFTEQPLYNMSTDIDGHNIFMMELGTLLQLSYSNGSMQMYQWLCHPSHIKIINESFNKLINECEANPPYNLASFHLINWIDKLNNDDLNMSVTDLVDMVKIFSENDPIDIDFDGSNNEAYLKNQLNEVKQILKSKNYKKVTEGVLLKVDKLFVKIQVDAYKEYFE